MRSEAKNSPDLLQHGGALVFALAKAAPSDALELGLDTRFAEGRVGFERALLSRHDGWQLLLHLIDFCIEHVTETMLTV